MNESKALPYSNDTYVHRPSSHAHVLLALYWNGQLVWTPALGV